MLEQLNQDIKEAMKNKQKAKLEALRYLKAMLLENKTAKKPIPEIDVVVKHCKKLQDSLETFPENHPQREKVQLELENLAAYRPEQLTDEAVKKLIQTIINQLDNPNVGAVMKELSPQIKGKFDGKLANQLVREALG